MEVKGRVQAHVHPSQEHSSAREGSTGREVQKGTPNTYVICRTESEAPGSELGTCCTKAGVQREAGLCSALGKPRAASVIPALGRLRQEEVSPRLAWAV